MRGGRVRREVLGKLHFLVAHPYNSYLLGTTEECRYVHDNRKLTGITKKVYSKLLAYTSTNYVRESHHSHNICNSRVQQVFRNSQRVPQKDV